MGWGPRGVGEGRTWIARGVRGGPSLLVSSSQNHCVQTTTVSNAGFGGGGEGGVRGWGGGRGWGGINWLETQESQSSSLT